MALRKEDKTWVTGEIRAEIQEHLNPHGWRKVQAFLPLVGVLSIFVALLALAGAGWKYAFSRIEAEAQFQTHTTDRLDSIEGALSVLKAQIAVQRYSAIPPKDLKGHRDELEDIKKNLVQAQRKIPGFWPATFQIIMLLSQARSEIEATGDETILDNVTSSPAKMYVTNRRVLLKNLVAGGVFRNSVIRFDPSVRLANDVFYNCIFIFPIEQNPSKPLQEIGNALLTSDLSQITIESAS